MLFRSVSQSRYRAYIDSLPDKERQVFIKLILETLGINETQLQELIKINDSFNVNEKAIDVIEKQINAKYDAELAALESDQ